MGKPKAVRKICIEIHPEAYRALKGLVDSGLGGKTVEETVERMVCEGLRDASVAARCARFVVDLANGDIRHEHDDDPAIHGMLAKLQDMAAAVIEGTDDALTH